MLSVEALEVRYGGYLAIEDVSLHVAAGEIVCLMGANGSGKSSLMNAVSGLVTPAAGRVEVRAGHLEFRCSRGHRTLGP